MALPDIQVIDEAEVTNVQPEVGASGVMIVRGDVFNIQDYVPELQGEQAMQVYEEIRNDPQIDASFFRLRAPVSSAEWSVPPYQSLKDKDGNKSSSDLDKTVADFVRRQTIDWDFLDDGSGWPGFLDHAALMCPYGVMPFEKVWGTNADGQQIVVKLAPRHPKSVIQFHIGRDRRLEWMEQWAYGPDGFDRFRIDGNLLVPFVYRKEGDNWWGRSLFRSCYMPWSIWRQLAIIDAMRHERHGMGIPVLEVPAGAGKLQMDQAKKVVKELRAHERQYIKLPPGFKLTWYFPTGAGTDILGSMRYWDELKARALHNEVMTLGSNVSGARNTGEIKQKAAYLAVMGLATLEAKVLKRYVITPMVRMNFGDKVGIPDLQIENLNALDVLELAQALKALREGDFLTPDDPTESYIRKGMQLPAHQAETARAKPIAAIQTAFQPSPPFADPNGPPISKQPPKGKQLEKGVPPDKGSKAGDPSRGVRKFGKLSRAPLPHEAGCAFDEYSTFMDEEPTRVYDDTVRPIRMLQMKAVTAAAVECTQKDLATGALSRRGLMKNRLAADLGDALNRSYMRGRLSIKEEMQRQRAGAAPGRPATASEPGVVKVTGADVLDASAKERARVKRMAELFAETSTEDMVDRATQVAMKARLAGMADAAVEERVMQALQSLSEAKVTSALQGDVIASFIYGRNDAAMSVKPEIEAAYYSAIMDDGTCEACAALDGQEHEPGDQIYATPNPNCAWPPHCRCATIYVFTRD